MAKPKDKVEGPTPPVEDALPETRGTAYLDRMHAIAKRRLIRCLTTDEFIKEIRGDPAEDPPLND